MGHRYNNGDGKSIKNWSINVSAFKWVNTITMAIDQSDVQYLTAKPRLIAWFHNITACAKSWPLSCIVWLIAAVGWYCIGTTRGVQPYTHHVGLYDRALIQLIWTLLIVPMAIACHIRPVKSGWPNTTTSSNAANNSKTCWHHWGQNWNASWNNQLASASNLSWY